MCVRQMESEGVSKEQACSQIYLIDIDGLITRARKNIDPRHVPFAKDMPESKDLLEIVKTVKPGALLGASTVQGAFTPEIIQEWRKSMQDRLFSPSQIQLLKRNAQPMMLIV